MRTKAIVVSTTHWDREWYWPLEKFRFHLVKVMDEIVETLENDPGFHSFTFDGQSIVIEDYLEIRPEKREALERLVQAGRLFFGPWYCQPDEFLVSGESLIRNLETGIRIAGQLGGWLRLGFTPDMFGHTAQLPQILRLLGMDAAIMTRGLGDQLEGAEVQTEFVWQGLDASKVRVLFQKNSYDNLAALGVERDRWRFAVAPQLQSDPELAVEQVKEQVQSLLPLAPSPVVLLNNGSDHLGIQPEFSRLCEQVNRSLDDVELVHGSYLNYLAEVEYQPEKLVTISGELRGAWYHYLLPGVFSTRAYLKIRNAEAENLLVSLAEPLSSLAAMRGGTGLDGFLEYAWKLLLQNHPHDSICGCSIDEVHREMETRFDKVMQVGRAVVAEAAGAVGAVDRANEGCELVVFNRSGWAIEWPVTARIKQSTQRQGEGPEQVDELTFMHRFGRGCGVEVLGPQTSLKAGTEGGDLRVHKDGVENRYLRLQLRESGKQGGLWLTDKTTGRTMGPLNVFHSFADAGDEYEFQPLADDGTGNSRAEMSLESITLDGPVATMVLCTLLPVPEGLSQDLRRRTDAESMLKFATRLRIWREHPIVHVKTRVENQAKFHKLAVLFNLPQIPSRLKCGTQFGEIVRAVSPESIEGARGETLPPWYPFREYVVEPESGFALFARGLLEVGTPPVGAEVPLALTLWRSVEHLSRDDIPYRPEHAGPYFVTPEAQCLRAMEFDYAFGVANSAGLLGDGLQYWQAGKMFSNPPAAWPVRETDWAGPGYLVHVLAPEVVLSSVRLLPGTDKLRITMYNATGKPIVARVELGFDAQDVRCTDLLGRDRDHETLTVEGTMLKMAFGAFQIVCLQATLGPAKAKGPEDKVG